MKGARFLLAVATIGASTSPAADHYRYFDGTTTRTDVYLGHVSYCERTDDGQGPSVLREDGAEAEPASVNTPLTSGDTIVTPAGLRCEAQFDTGTIVRLGGDTSLRLEAILAPAITTDKKLTNLVLGRGRIYVLYSEYDSQELFQVLTPNAAVQLRDAAVAVVEHAGDGTTVQTERGASKVLFGPNRKQTARHTVRAGQRVVVGPEHTFAVNPPLAEPARSEFAGWNRWMNERFQPLHAARNALPKPVLRQPRAVVDFAQRWSTLAGEWVWSDLYGYAWRPQLNQDQAWRPFLRGRWVGIRDKLYWVPDEPWGWVPYHLGYWTWMTQGGWVWVPGAAFASAWVDWELCGDKFRWRPWSAWSWLDHRTRALFPMTIDASLCGDERWPSVLETRLCPTSVRVPPPPPRPPRCPTDGRRPRGVPPLTDRMRAAYKAGDPALQRELAVVTRSTASALHTALPGRRPGAQREAAPDAVRDRRAAAGDGPSAARFRDWNPDVRAALEVGGRIVYSSHHNAVRCEDCRVALTQWVRGWALGANSAVGGGSDGSSGASGASASQDTGATGGRDSGRDARERIHD